MGMAVNGLAGLGVSARLASPQSGQHLPSRFYTAAAVRASSIIAGPGLAGPQPASPQSTQHLPSRFYTGTVRA